MKLTIKTQSGQKVVDLNSDLQFNTIKGEQYVFSNGFSNYVLNFKDNQESVTLTFNVNGKSIKVELNGIVPLLQANTTNMPNPTAIIINKDLNEKDVDSIVENNRFDGGEIIDRLEALLSKPVELGDNVSSNLTLITNYQTLLESLGAAAAGAEAGGNATGNGSTFNSIFSINDRGLNDIADTARWENLSESIANIPVDTADNTGDRITIFTSMTSSDVNENADSVTFNIFLSYVPQGTANTVTVNVTDQNGNVITYIVDINAEGRGVLTIKTQDMDVYNDSQSLTAEIVAINGGDYEEVVFGTPVTVNITDIGAIDDVTLLLDDVNVNEGTGTATVGGSLDYAPQTTLVVTLSNGATITFGPDYVVGTIVQSTPFVIQGDDVYKDGETYTVTVVSTTGGNFENLVTTDTSTVTVTDTETPVTVNLSASTVNEDAANTSYVFTATLSAASQGDTIIVTDKGTITIADGQTTGTLTIASNNTSDVYVDRSELIATITSASGGNFEKINVGTATAKATVTDTETPVTVNLSASTVNEDAANTSYVFTATLSAASQGDTIIVTDKGTITIADGQTTGTLTIASNNTSDVYVDASELTATITSVSGGNFEKINVGTATAKATVTDTETPVTVNLSASTVDEDAANTSYVFTATLSAASQGVTTIVTDKGTITIADGETTGTLTIASNNTSDVYVDASELTATITSVSGGNFEKINVGTATAKATVTDTETPVTVNLSASTVDEDAANTSYVFTATLSAASQGVTTIVTDKGTITIADGETTGTLTIASNNTSDVYVDASELTATISSASGGNFEKINVGTATAKATVTDTETPVTVNLSASTVDEDAANTSYVFTATLSAASQGVTTIVTDKGTITIADGETTGTLTIASNNTSDVYVDASELTATITSVSGGNFEKINVGTATAKATVTDTETPVTVNLSASTVDEDAANTSYVFTATLSAASQGVTTIVTDKGTITIADGETTGTLTIASNNTSDVYVDASELTATITSVSGGNFEKINVGTATAKATVTDTETPVTVNLSASTVDEDAANTSYVFTATLSAASQGVTTIVTDKGTITIADGETTGTLTIASNNTSDVYVDASELTATITSVSGGNFEKINVGTATAKATVTDTETPVTVNLSASTVDEDAANTSYVFTATLSAASQGVTTIVTDKGTITIADGETTGTLTIASNNTSDVYVDASELTATITSVSGGNFEKINVGTATAKATVTDTETPVTVNLSASTVDEDAANTSYVFTATLSAASQGVTTIVTDKGTITIADGETTGTLTIASNNTSDVYVDASELTATITSVSGGNFEKINVGTATAKATVTDTETPVTVNLSASTVDEDAANTSYVFTATLSAASQGVTTIVTDKGTITIADGETTGTLTIASNNTSDVYVDASELTATITSVSGGNFEKINVGTATAKATVTDTETPVTVNLSASTVDEDAANTSYVFTATLSAASQGVTTIVTDKGTITIADGETTGTLTIASNNTSDVYVDASELTATITSVSGGNFEKINVGTATAKATVTDTETPVTVNLSASTVDEDAANTSYVFTATLSAASQGVTTIVTDKGTITIADGETTGTLTIASNNTSDVYVDASELTATITSVSGGNFEKINVGTATAKATVTDTETPVTVNLSASTVDEDAANTSYVFTATLSAASQGVTTIVTDKGTITIADGETTGTLTIASNNTSDVYVDASELTATITSVSGGNFEKINVGTATAKATVTDTETPVTVNLSASTVDEDAANTSYVFTATLSAASQGVTTIVTDKGTITIADGETTGTLTIASNNTSDVYVDASELTATITSVSGGNFEKINVGTATAKATVTDTETPVTVNLSASTVDEDAANTSYVFTATLSAASQGVTTIVTDKGTITIADGETTGTLTIASNNTSDVYVDASELTATITSVSGGNFEKINVGTATAKATVTDTETPVTVNLSASTVDEDAANTSYVFTATLSAASQGVTTIVTDKGTITIADGETTGTLTIASNNTSDVYVDASELTATITSVSGGNFEKINVGTATAKATVTDTETPVTVNLSASTVDEDAANTSYVFTATLSAASQGVTTIVTDKGTITIADGETTGTLTIASNNTSDVYVDASELTATITSVSGGNFEKINVGTATAKATVTDTETPVTVNLSASTVDEDAANTSYVFTATLSAASQGVTTIVTDKGTITIADGETTGTLTIASNNTSDVYVDASELTATITSVSGGNFEKINVGTATAKATVTDTETPVTVNLSASTVDEDAANTSYVFTATLSAASQGVTTIVTDKGTITIADGETTGTLTIASNNTSDVYVDASELTATITSVSGGNFEKINVGTATAKATVTDTETPVTVNLSASTVDEDAANTSYVFTATLSAASQGVTTIVTDKGTITIADGETTGTLTIASNNTSDVYVDASELTATITSVSGGNFEKINVGTATAKATVTDTETPVTVNLSASTVDEDAANTSYVFTATLSAASQGVTTIVTDKGTITIADGETTGTLTIASNNTSDVYVDASELTATISSASGGNFEKINVGTATAKATVTDTENEVYVDVTASSTNLNEGDGVTYTVTLRNQDGLEVKNHGGLNITLSNGVEITILAGQDSATSSEVKAPLGSNTIEVQMIVETATADFGKQFEDIQPGQTVTVNASSSTLLNDTAIATENGSENIASEDSLDTINVQNDGQTASGNVLFNDTVNNNTKVSKITFEGKETIVKSYGNTEIIGKYGTLTINSKGEYTYKVNDDNSDVDALNVGDKLAEYFTYTTSDEKAAVLTVEVEGRNDAPIISKIETNGVTLTGIYNDYRSDNISEKVTAKDLIENDGSNSYQFKNENNTLKMDLGTTKTNVDISYEGKNAANKSILGYYEKNADGTIGNLKIIFVDGSDTSAKSIQGITGEIGFFLIPNGANNTNIMNIINGGNYQVERTKDGKIIFSSNGKLATASDVYYTDESLSTEKKDHTIALKSDNPNSIIIGFEDQSLKDGSTDFDYNDFVISVKFTPSESLSNKLFTNIDFSDVDDDSLSEATVTLTNAIDGDKINIAGDLKEGITYTTEYKDGKLIIKFSGIASHEAYEEALEAIRFSTKNSENERELKFEIEIKDPNGKTDKNSVVIIGKGFDNDTPTIGDERVETKEDISYTFSIKDFGSYKDIDGDSIETIKIVTLPDPKTEGTLKYDGVVITAGKEILVKDLGKLVFEPVSNSDKDASFTFQVSDSRGAYSYIKTMTVGVEAVADAPMVSIDITKIGDTGNSNNDGNNSIGGIVTQNSDNVDINGNQTQRIDTQDGNDNVYISGNAGGMNTGNGDGSIVKGDGSVFDDTTTVYKYDISLSAQLTDGSEKLSDVTLKNIPEGSKLFGADEKEINANDNGTYTVKVDENGEAELSLTNEKELSDTELNSIQTSATSTDTPTDGKEESSQATTFDGEGDIDLTSIIGQYKVNYIDLENGKANDIELNFDEILADDKEIYIKGDDKDSISLNSELWKEAESIKGEDGVKYNVYTGTNSADNSTIKLFIDDEIKVNHDI